MASSSKFQRFMANYLVVYTGVQGKNNLLEQPPRVYREQCPAKQCTLTATDFNAQKKPEGTVLMQPLARG